jgi:hypothetical protein
MMEVVDDCGESAIGLHLKGFPIPHGILHYHARVVSTCSVEVAVIQTRLCWMRRWFMRAGASGHLAEESHGCE